MSTGPLRMFYASTAWKKCRNAFFASKFGLCEVCQVPGEIVHHIKPITAGDVRSNPAKCYGWNNLKLLCRICHEQHHIKRSDGLSFDANGDIVFVKDLA